MDTVIRKDDANSRYELIDPADDDRVLGIVAFRLHDTTLDIFHTEVDPEFGGHGLASELAVFVLNDAREHGFSVIPRCSFFSRYIAGHKEYLDLVPEQERGLVRPGSAS